jgi:hypothetical protein
MTERQDGLGFRTLAFLQNIDTGDDWHVDDGIEIIRSTDLGFDAATLEIADSGETTAIRATIGGQPWVMILENVGTTGQLPEEELLV